MTWAGFSKPVPEAAPKHRRLLLSVVVKPDNCAKHSIATKSSNRDSSHLENISGTILTLPQAKRAYFLQSIYRTDSRPRMRDERQLLLIVLHETLFALDFPWRRAREREVAITAHCPTRFQQGQATHHPLSAVYWSVVKGTSFLARRADKKLGEDLRSHWSVCLPNLQRRLSRTTS
jgi:hypothetical protein